MTSPAEPERDPNLTRQGFIKADKLTREQLEAIVALVEEGFVGGKATRQHGTSFTQFWRRVQREPDLLARMMAYKEKVEAEEKEKAAP
jgi:hypothetical protein